MRIAFIYNMIRIVKRATKPIYVHVKKVAVKWST